VHFIITFGIICSVKAAENEQLEELQSHIDCLKEESQEKEQTEDSPAHKRRKPNRKGQDAITLDPNLPVKTVIIDVPEEEKICKETGISLVQIGVETTHKLAHEPGSYSIKEIIRPK